MNREEKIMARLQEHYNYLIEKGHEVVALMLQGSQNYDLDIYTEEYQSDIDSKAIILPSFEDLYKTGLLLVILIYSITMNILILKILELCAKC